MSKSLLFTKLKTPFFLPKIKFRILINMNFHALDAVILILAKTEHANSKSYKTILITHLLNCPDALYLANLNTFPDLDSSKEFPDNIHCPTSLVYNNSKILFSCKYNNPNQLLVLEALLIKRKIQ